MSGDENEQPMGSTSGEVPLEGPRTEATITVSPAAAAGVLARMSSASTEHVYLALESIRGTHDASVLKVFLRLPEDAAAGPRDFYAGSVGLYGMRRASARRAESAERGLKFVLDVTPFFQGLTSAPPSPLEALVVSIRPRRALPAGAVVVGRLRLFHKAYAP